MKISAAERPVRKKGFWNKYLAPGIIAAVFLLTSLQSKAQIGLDTSSHLVINISGWAFKWNQGGFTYRLTPPRDTFRLSIRDTFSIAWKNGILYYYHFNAGVLKWDPILTGGGGGAWGSITGTLSAQTDLNTALNLRLLKSDSLSMLAPYLTLRQRHGDTLAVHNIRLVTQRDSLLAHNIRLVVQRDSLLSHTDQLVALRAAGGGGGGTGQSDSITTVSSNTTVSHSNNVVLVNTSSGNKTITINPATFYSSGAVRPVYVMKITNDVNTVTITPSSGTINGVGSYVLTGYNEGVKIYTNGTNLFIL